MLKASKSLKKFFQHYILAITVIILTIFIQSVIQYSLQKQHRSALIINLAGQQRMLSQQVLAKFYECRLLECNNAELKVSLERFYRMHKNLQNGNPKLELEPLESVDIRLMFNNLDTHIDYIYNNLNDFDKLQKADISLVEKEASSFLLIMNDIVTAFQKQAEEEVRTLMIIELELAFISILIILLEIYFIINPSIKKIQLQNKKLKDISWHQTHAFNSHMKNIKGLQHIIKIEKKIENKEELVTCIMDELDSLEEVSVNMVNSLKETSS